MEEDDLEPRNEKPPPKNLAGMSIDALHEYIGELEAEIQRARETIASRQEALGAADSVFGS